MQDEIVELTADELEKVGGGMKTDPNYVSKNVIDARGGSFRFMGLFFAMDLNGHVSVS